MTTPNLRPLSFGEILDGAFTLYRRNFLRFLATSALVTAGLFVAVVLLVAFGLLASSAIPRELGAVALLLIGVCVMMLTTMPWSTLAWQAARSYEGKPQTLGDALEAAGGGALRLVGCTIVAVAGLVGVVYVFTRIGGVLVEGLGLAGGVLAGLAGLAACVCVGALFFAVMPVVLLEDRGVVAAIARSVRLARGDVPRIGAVLFVAWLIVYLPSLASLALIGGMEQLASPAVTDFPAQLRTLLVERLISIVITIVTLPFLPSVLMLLYYDRRVRTEALDVELAASELKLAGA